MRGMKHLTLLYLSLLLYQVASRMSFSIHCSIVIHAFETQSSGNTHLCKATCACMLILFSALPIRRTCSKYHGAGVVFKMLTCFSSPRLVNHRVRPEISSDFTHCLRARHEHMHKCQEYFGSCAASVAHRAHSQMP